MNAGVSRIPALSILRRDEPAPACGPGQADLPLPDLERWHRSPSGIAHVIERASGRPGPTVLLTALVHGNEACGAFALDRLLSAGLVPARGRLFCAFANMAAYARIDPITPEAGRFVDEDMNRLWTAERLDLPGSSPELDRARELRRFVDQADFLLDLHSMREGEAPLALCGLSARGLALVRRMGFPGAIVIDEGHKDGVRLRDYGPFGAAEGARTALLVECGPHFAARSGAVAIEAALRFLLALDMVDPGFAGGFIGTPASWPQRILRVTDIIAAATKDFAFVRPVRNLEAIPKAGTLIAREEGREFRTPYDECVLIMPAQQPRPGLTAVRLGREVSGAASKE